MSQNSLKWCKYIVSTSKLLKVCNFKNNRLNSLLTALCSYKNEEYFRFFKLDANLNVDRIFFFKTKKSIFFFKNNLKICFIFE